MAQATMNWLESDYKMSECKANNGTRGNVRRSPKTVLVKGEVLT